MGLSNNDIMKKLRVAHKLRTEDMVEIIGLAGLHVNKGQLNDLFRADDHPSFVPCGDQIVRNFLDGLIIKLRGPRPPKKKDGDPEIPAKPRKIITLDKQDKPKKRIKKSERN